MDVLAETLQGLPGVGAAAVIADFDIAFEPRLERLQISTQRVAARAKCIVGITALFDVDIQPLGAGRLCPGHLNVGGLGNIARRQGNAIGVAIGRQFDRLIADVSASSAAKVRMLKKIWRPQ